MLYDAEQYCHIVTTWKHFNRGGKDIVTLFLGCRIMQLVSIQFILYDMKNIDKVKWTTE